MRMECRDPSVEAAMIRPAIRQNDGNTKQAQWISRMSKFTATSQYIILQKIHSAGEAERGSQPVAACHFVK